MTEQEHLWERRVITKLAQASLKEQKRARRWSIFFKFLVFAYITFILYMFSEPDLSTATITNHSALVELQGLIADGESASADNIVSALRSAFEDEKTQGVILRINSPGGTPVQAGYIYDEIVRLREKYPDIPLYAVVSDMAASGGYYVASAADKIYVSNSSIVGSIGVRINNFGVVDAMEKLGVESRTISAGEHKWGKFTGLVMLLPHGYEGQGAEHSSARIERYLQLCSSHNMQVCVPSTPAQMFHLLRRQMVRNCRKPLVVITPKSLLRHKDCTSSLDDLVSGYYQRALPEIDDIDPAKVKYVLLCSGKVYYELLHERRAKKRNDIAIVRVEQLYPFPGPELNELLKCYDKTDELVWVQEEPKNQGAWDFVKPRIPAMLDRQWNLSYVGRESSSAPAVGSAKLHAVQQRDLVDRAINFNRTIKK